MLVNHPNMSITELPPEQVELHTLPNSIAVELTNRMGPPMANWPLTGEHWYAKLDGQPIHLKLHNGAYYLECLASQTSKVSRSIHSEINNGIIITNDNCR